MKSLQTIQKTFRVFQILSKIAMILSFIWAGMAALGLLCAMVWLNGGTVFGADQELIHRMTATGSLTEMIGVLLVDMILALTDGTLLAFALRYFKAEQAGLVGDDAAGGQLDTLHGDVVDIDAQVVGDPVHIILSDVLLLFDQA